PEQDDFPAAANPPPRRRYGQALLFLVTVVGVPVAVARFAVAVARFAVAVAGPAVAVAGSAVPVAAIGRATPARTRYAAPAVAVLAICPGRPPGAESSGRPANAIPPGLVGRTPEQAGSVPPSCGDDSSTGHRPGRRG